MHYSPCQFQLAGLKLAGWQNQVNNRQGQPLFLACHGWLDNANSFLPLVHALPELRWLAFDWPGHGHSQHVSEEGHYPFMDWLDYLYQLLALLDEPVVLVGHSMGALACSVFAGCFPERLQGLILLEGFGPLTAEPCQSVSLVRDALSSRARIRAREPLRTCTLEQAIAARLAVSDGYLTQRSAQLLCERNLKVSEPMRYQWRYDPKLKTFSPLRMTEPQAQAFLRNIDCEVLAISASHGHDNVKNHLTQRKQWIAHLQCTELPGGHHLHMDSTSAVAEVMRTWWATRSIVK